MSKHSLGLCAVLVVFTLSGCGVVTGSKKDSKAQAKNQAKGIDKQLAMETGNVRDTPLPDPSSMIPPPPNMFPAIPEAPGPDTSLVSASTNDGGRSAANAVIPASAVRAPIETARGASETNLQAAKRIHQRAAEQFAKIEGFDAKITRREMVGTKSMPEETLQYKFRKAPYSLHAKWIGKEAQGREMVYVEGKYEGKVQILTGREPELLRPSGIKVARLPTDKDVTSKSRFDVRRSGMALSIEWLGKVVAIMEQDSTQSNRIRYLGQRPRLERQSGLEAIEETIPADWEPLLPKGGKRTTYFDSDSNSPSYGLPVLIVTLNDMGRECEYYWFDQFQPCRPTDADFDIAKLWKR